MRKKKVIKPLAFSIYYWTAWAIASVGLLVSIYLSFSHYRVYTDIGYKSICAISKSLNCDTIAQSKYSVLFGVPVAVWGVLGYLLFLLLMMIGGIKKKNRESPWPLLFVISAFFSLCSLILGYISTAHIRSYCLFCIISYGVNFLLTYFSLIIVKRFYEDRFDRCIFKSFRWFFTNKKVNLFIFGFLTISTVLLMNLYPDYWNLKAPKILHEIPRGLTDEGNPWMGAIDPKLTIIEYTDYKCFQCRKMHFFLRDLLIKHPDKIKLIHRYYPMDHEYNPSLVKEPFHIGAGKLALIAIYASTTDKFWEVNDLLYEFAPHHKEINLRYIADKTGLDVKQLYSALNNNTFASKLKWDILIGNKLGITGTPAYEIDNEVYIGQIPENIFKNILK